MVTRRFLSALLSLFLGLNLWGVEVSPALAATHISWLETPTVGSDGFAKAQQPKVWNFPEDFGPHPDYQTEWWYYTGNLETETGRPFGFQFTVFRQGLEPMLAEVSVNEQAASPWRTPQIYSAHFTVSDIAEDDFYHEERFSRGSVGLAGAMVKDQPFRAIASPYQVWIGDWSATALQDNQVKLQAQTETVAIDLVVSQSRDPLLQGDRGLSQKGPEPGNASYYYSLVQQPTQGTITVKGKSYPVKGITWKDHEYSTSALSPGTVGWDWFSAQFDNGAALMLYRLRHEDGSTEPHSAGKFITATGEEIAIAPEDWTIEVAKTWASPHSKAVYPAQWQITIPRLDLGIKVNPQMADQELHTSTATYWEGAVTYNGKVNNQPLAGQGYVELTGYADRLDNLLAER